MTLALGGTVDSTTHFLKGLKNFLAATKYPTDALMKLQILEAARFVVCTAATAVKLPSRIRNMLEALPATSADSHSNAPSAADELAQSLATLSIARGSRSRTSARPAVDAEDDSALTAALSGVLCFKYVVLDEAGAMLEPDMVGTVVHGCRFLLCVGDHKQVCPSRLCCPLRWPLPLPIAGACTNCGTIGSTAAVDH